jgi:hypothetical protein
VNLDADALGRYAKMIQAGCAVLMTGTATFRGGTVAGHTDCNDDPAYADWPGTVAFELCFPSPVSLVNCQNPDNDPARPIEGEEHQRGVALSPSRSIVAQMTIHTDHPFWDAVVHDAPLHFDQLAARVAGQATDGGVPTVTLEMTKGVDYTAYTDAQGRGVKWRYCIDPPTDVHPPFHGAMSFDPGSVPHSPDGDPGEGLRDYYDFALYDQSTQGHLNSDGLCYVRRNYPSPR